MSAQHDEYQQEHSANNHKRKANFLPWMIVAILASLLVFNYLGTPGSNGLSLNGFSWLPVLLGLACPLMMLFMMFGHGHGGSGNESDQHTGHGGCCGHQPRKTSEK